MLALAASFVGILVAVAFLTFTWYGASQATRGELPPALWQMILEKQWMTRVVTVCAILIRVASSTQMGVFAALVAAIVLERTGVIAEQLALMSVIRSVNNGPRSHLRNAFISVRSGVRLGYVAIVSIAFLTLVALQFTSTLLLGDFSATDVVIGTTQDSLAFGVTALPNGSVDTNAASSYALSSTGIDPWRSSPATYVRFAELSQSPSKGPDYVDTGSSLRAFVPLRLPDDRSALRNFTGPATVVDTRVICIAPSIMIYKVQMSADSASLYFNLTMEGSYPGLHLSDPRQFDTESHHSLVRDTYICGAQTVWDNTSTTWGLSICDVSQQGWTIDMDLGIKPDTSLETPLSYLTFNTSGGINWPDSFLWTSDTDEDVSAGVEWQQTTSGPWRNIYADVDGRDIGLNVSLCFSNPTTDDFHVDISGENHASEPTISWNAQQREYDTRDVRSLLGAVAEPLTPRQRGIYDLAQPSVQEAQATMPFVSDAISNALFFSFPMTSVVWNSNETEDQNDLMPTVVLGESSSGNAMHVTHDAIFTQTLKETGNPALALQALNTVLTQVTYYDSLPRFELSSPAQLRMVSKVSVPAKWTELIIVMVLLAMHSIMLIAAIVVFLLATEHTQLGNIWQTVAQISSRGTSDILNQVTGMSDKEVRNYLKSAGKAQLEVVLVTSADSRQSEAIFCSRT